LPKYFNKVGKHINLSCYKKKINNLKIEKRLMF
jgi:hypothetical protein